jgi:hypothetical protein
MNAVQAIIGVISKTLPIVNGVTTLLGVRKTEWFENIKMPINKILIYMMC